MIILIDFGFILFLLLFFGLGILGNLSTIVYVLIGVSIGILVLLAHGFICYAMLKERNVIGCICSVFAVIILFFGTYYCDTNIKSYVTIMLIDIIFFWSCYAFLHMGKKKGILIHSIINIAMVLGTALMFAWIIGYFLSDIVIKSPDNVISYVCDDSTNIYDANISRFEDLVDQNVISIEEKGRVLNILKDREIIPIENIKRSEFLFPVITSDGLEGRVLSSMDSKLIYDKDSEYVKAKYEKIRKKSHSDIFEKLAFELPPRIAQVCIDFYGMVPIFDPIQFA